MPAIDHENLVKAMDKANVTPAQLAEVLGVSRTYVADLRSGRRKLKNNPELRHRIAVALDVPRHWIEHQSEVPA